jgi:hypothetical protein
MVTGTIQLLQGPTKIARLVYGHFLSTLETLLENTVEEKVLRSSVNPWNGLDDRKDPFPTLSLCPGTLERVPQPL